MPQPNGQNTVSFAALVLHPQTARAVELFLRAPAHALLIVGQPGIGKRALAMHIAATMLKTEPTTLATHPYVLTLQPEDGGNISIDLVRRLQAFTQLKTAGTNPIRRVIIIEQAATLTTEAQNALLKLLEEPPADTVILLTAESARQVLPTITSRTQVLTVEQPDPGALRTHFTASTTQPEATVAQALQLSGGLPGLMSGLLNTDEPHPLTASVQAAKDLLQKPTFERLAAVDGLAKQKAETTHVLQALARIAASALAQAATKHDQTAIARWHRIRKEVSYAQAALQNSANAKLVLTKMLLHF